MLLAAAAGASGAQVKFGDGDFASGGPGCPPNGSGHTLAGYELVKDVRGGPDGPTWFARQDTDGSPGAFVRVTINPQGGQITACMLKNDAVYDPAVQGGFASFDWKEDSRCYDPEATQCMSTGLCVRQAGNLYVASAGFVPGDAWVRRSRSGIAPADFSWLSGPSGRVPLDVSASGAPLQLGFFRAKSGGPGEETGLDNWQVATRDPCTDTVQCDDGDLCTTDLCDVGICRSTPLDCDDGDGCTADTCSAGACGHTPLDCDDGSPCTTDACSSGSCTHAAATDLALARARLNELRDLITAGQCGNEPLVKKLKKKLKKPLAKADRFLAKAERASDPTAVGRQLAKAAPLLPLVRAGIDGAVASGRLSQTCASELQGFLDDVQACIAGS
jgi:hypothetical protein